MQWCNEAHGHLTPVAFGSDVLTRGGGGGVKLQRGKKLLSVLPERLRRANWVSTWQPGSSRVIQAPEGVHLGERTPRRFGRTYNQDKLTTLFRGQYLKSVLGDYLLLYLLNTATLGQTHSHSKLAPSVWGGDGLFRQNLPNAQSVWQAYRTLKMDNVGGHFLDLGPLRSHGVL